MSYYYFVLTPKFNYLYNFNNKEKREGQCGYDQQKRQQG